MRIRGWIICLLIVLTMGLLSGCSVVSEMDSLAESFVQAASGTEGEQKVLHSGREKMGRVSREAASESVFESETESDFESVTESVDEPASEAISEAAGTGSLAEGLTDADTKPAGRENDETVPETEYSNGHCVAIDPGHQGSWVDMSAPEPVAPGSGQTKARCTTGTTGRYTGVAEFQLNLDISLALRAELEERGYQVLMTREDNDTAISNSERALFASEHGAEISVRIHANGSDDPSVNGALAMSMSPQNPYVGSLYEKSYALAQAILNDYCAVTGFANRGIQLTDDMTGFNWSKVPVMILEMGFMTNQSDDTLMQDPAMQRKMVQGIADGIDDYYGLAHDAARKANTSSDAARQTDAQGLIEDPEMGSEDKNAQEQLEGTAALLYEQFLAAREIQGETWAFAIMDADSDKAWSWHGALPMQSASVIKLFIMGTVYDRMCYPSSPDRLIPFHESYDGELRAVLEQMITVSSNEAANRLIDALGQGNTAAGKEVVNEFCREHGFVSTHLGRKFLESNPADDNYISALDTASILRQICQGTLVNEDASQKMLTILKGQTVRGKIPAALPEGFQSANKTGEMPEGYGLGCIENDAAVIWTPSGAAYVLVVLSNDLNGRNDQAAEVIRSIAGFSAQHAEEWTAEE